MFKRPFELDSTVYQMESLGVRSVGIASVTAIFVGMVMAVQFAFGLQKFGGMEYTGRVIGLSFSRELAPTLTAVIVGGRIKAAATSLLDNKGFVVNATEQNDPKVPVGTVISQSPAGNQKADVGSVVTIVVSTGPSAITVPDVSGQSVATASANLTSAGFKVNESQQSSEKVAAGKVIGTNPSAGTQAAPGSTVTIIVSTGPTPTTTTTSTTTTTASVPPTTKKP